MDNFFTAAGNTKLKIDCLMKKLVLTVWVAACCCCLPGLVLSQSTVSKKVLLSIQPGESIVTSESCIDVGYSADQLFVVTRKGDQFFIYEGGVRKGPFNSKMVRVKNCGERHNESCSVYATEQSAASFEIISYSEQGGMTINFKGKKYGPYTMVTALQMAKDGSSFLAAVTDDGEHRLVSSGGLSQPLPGQVSYLHMSSSGRQYLAVSQESGALEAEMANIDFSKLTQDQLVALAQKMAAQQEQAGQPKVFVFTAGGKKFGPYPASDIYESSPAFCRTGGDNWYMVSDNTLYINGVKVKQYAYDQISFSTCDVWLTPDGKRYAIAGYDKILFSDGSSGPAPLKTDCEMKDGKVILKWISLENGKDIVACSREI